MMSMRSSLLGVKLDDERFAHRHVDVLAKRCVDDSDLEAFGSNLEPWRNLPVQGIEVVPDDDHRARLVLERYHVCFTHAVARDRDALSVHQYVSVTYELACLSPARTPAGAEHHVLCAQLEHA